MRLDAFEYVTPPEIARDPQAKAAFDAQMEQQANEYKRIAALLKDGHIRRLTQQGMDEKQAARKAEKLAIEDARFLLPNACGTKMIVTMNARSLNNFFRHRCCARAVGDPRLGGRNAAPCAGGGARAVRAQRAALRFRRVSRGRDELRRGRRDAEKI